MRRRFRDAGFYGASERLNKDAEENAAYRQIKAEGEDLSGKKGFDDAKSFWDTMLLQELQ